MPLLVSPFTVSPRPLPQAASTVYAPRRRRTPTPSPRPRGTFTVHSYNYARAGRAVMRSGGTYCCFANKPTCLRAAPVAREKETARGNRTPTAGTRVPSHSFRPERSLSEVEDTAGRVSVQATLWNVCTRPRASVAVTVPLISSTATEARNAAMPGPRTRGQSAGGLGTQSRGYLRP